MYKVIVAGCGMMSDKWIEIANGRKDCEIVAIIDPNVDTAKSKKEKHNLKANIYSNAEAALSKEDANLLFDISTPDAHYDVVTRALEAGCNVFGEKPMSDTLENAEKMVECAERTGKEYFVMQNRRYVPGIASLKSFLQSGQLGTIGQISASFQLDPHFGGFRDEMDSPLIADMAIHTFDAARFITGKNPVSVYCHQFNPPWSWYKGDANAVCIFEMEDGSVFDYRGSWCANGLNTSWESQWRVSCAKGAAFWDGESGLYYDIASDGVAKTGISGTNEISSSLKKIQIADLKNVGHLACITEMFGALENGTRAQTDCRDNIKSVRMVYKAIESSKNRKVIAL